MVCVFSEGDIHFDRSLQLVMRSRYSSDIVAETSNQETQAPHLESWRTQVYYAGGPRGVNTLSSEAWTKVLQSFYRQIMVDNTSC